MAYAAWTASTAYVVGDVVRATTVPETGLVFKCVDAGTSGGTEPQWPRLIAIFDTTSGTRVQGYVEDGGVVWAAITQFAADLQGVAPSGIIELFVLETFANLHGSASTYRFHAGANATSTYGQVVFAGNTYLRYPVEATGFEYNGQGQLPRPTLRVANLVSTITAILQAVNTFNPGNDLLGAKVTRIRTLIKYLDAANFEGGTNPYGTPDPTAEFPRDEYYVARKSFENREVVEFELAAVFDLQNVRAPRRQVIANICPWTYRGDGCNYTGDGYFDRDDIAVTTLAADVCGKRLSSCKLRFDTVTVSANVTSGSTTMTGLTLNEVQKTSTGNKITGYGLPAGTTVAAKNLTAPYSLTLSQAATATNNPFTRTGTLASDGLSITVSSATGIKSGVAVSGVGIPAGTKVASVSGTTINLNIDLNDLAWASATTKSVTYKGAGGGFYGDGQKLYRLAMSNTSGINIGDLVVGSGVVKGTKVIYSNGASEVLVDKALQKNKGDSLSATFYVPVTFSSSTYTFTPSKTYSIRPNGELPFGGFPGVGGINI
jgi:lambda family phage minor tail protein L